jgi:signal transduction histidine kinase
LALWAWLGLCLLAGILALAGGAERAALGQALALLAAPSLAGFILLPWLCAVRWADFGLIAAWIVAAAGLVSGGGGADSPFGITLMLGPAWALALGRRWAPEAGAAAALAYAAAIGLAQFTTPPFLAALPEMTGASALAFAAGLLALSQVRTRTSPRTGERIAEVSHELRTPLTHILGFSEMIERQIFGPVSDRYVEYAGLIRKSGGHLLGVVNDLLDLSKLDAGRYEIERESFDARMIVEEVVRLSVDLAQKKAIALGMTTPEAPLNVSADPRALRRILINTLGNALKFTPEGGRVIIAARAEDGALVLDTIDNGPGIPKAERARLGQAFERGAGVGRIEGAGLGLSLVRALAALHDGTLSFHDAPGGGALVRVRLPVLVSA